MGLFHQYDIRGIYGKELTEEFAYNLGTVILKYTKAKSIIIGYDSRIGNLKLFSALAKAIIDQGVNVIHAGIVTRPMLNWIAWKHKFDLGIVITASHNPKEYNGFKFIWKGKILCYDNGLDKVEGLMQDMTQKKMAKMKKGLKSRISKRAGRIISKDYIDEYVRFLSSHLSGDYRKYVKGRTIRVVADASNGSAGEIIKRFLLENDITYELLFTHPDGTFYCHSPNPLDPNATIVLSKKVLEFKADFGFIVDPDGDRIRFVDDKGRTIENNYVDCLVIENMLRKHKRATIVHDVVSRKILLDVIKKNHGTNIVSKVGTSNIIQNMADEKAIFGCEMSGHRYFSVMNNQDSGLMMLVYLLNTLSDKSHAGKKLSGLWKRYDKYVDVGELNYKLLDDKKKDSVMAEVLEYYSKNRKKLGVKNILSIDGMNVVAGKYWFTLRPSNTEPLLRLRIEGKNAKDLLKVRKQVEKFINK